MINSDTESVQHFQDEHVESMVADDVILLREKFGLFWYFVL